MVGSRRNSRCVSSDSQAREREKPCTDTPLLPRPPSPNSRCAEHAQCHLIAAKLPNKRSRTRLCLPNRSQSFASGVMAVVAVLTLAGPADEPACSRRRGRDAIHPDSGGSCTPSRWQAARSRCWVLSSVRRENASPLLCRRGGALTRNYGSTPSAAALRPPHAGS